MPTDYLVYEKENVQKMYTCSKSASFRDCSPELRDFIFVLDVTCRYETGEYID